MQAVQNLHFLLCVSNGGRKKALVFSMYLKLNAAHQIHRKEVKGVPCLACVWPHQMSSTSQFVAECKHRQIKTSGINSQQGLAFRRHLGQYIQNYDRGRGKKGEIITSSRSAGWVGGESSPTDHFSSDSAKTD